MALQVRHAGACRQRCASHFVQSLRMHPPVIHRGYDIYIMGKRIYIYIYIYIIVVAYGKAPLQAHREGRVQRKGREGQGAWYLSLGALLKVFCNRLNKKKLKQIPKGAK